MLREFEAGRRAYEALGECVETAIEEENSEVAVICALPLAKLAEAEMASYFGYEGYYNYNTAINIAEEALEYAKEEGVPSWLRDDLNELERTIRELRE